jgi:hypothetical protein
VRKVRVGRDAVDFDAQPLEFGVVVGQIAQFGRADESEVCRVEEDDRPFAAQVGVGDGNELASMESGGVERKVLLK